MNIPHTDGIREVVDFNAALVGRLELPVGHQGRGQAGGRA
jgi:hypothetical protein